jgi:2-amino-4-hydroxy-6-hydroxymethyldihydropteridine diphosphokinase
MPLIYLGLGSNQGDRRLNLEKAIRLLSAAINIDERSSIYETEPEDYKEQPDFLNMVISATTQLEPVPLLKFAKKIEVEMGRKPDFSNAPRPIDIDLLFYGNKAFESPELIIPHPRLTSRAFVLVPMNEIAPQFVHPGNKKSIKMLLAELGTITGVVKLDLESR